MVVGRCADGAAGRESAVSIQVYHGAAAASSGRVRRQQFQIWVAPAGNLSAVRPMVDALRFSTLQNPLHCRVDKARRSVSGPRHGGRARRIHRA